MVNVVRHGRVLVSADELIKKDVVRVTCPMCDCRFKFDSDYPSHAVVAVKGLECVVIKCPDCKGKFMVCTSDEPYQYTIDDLESDCNE